MSVSTIVASGGVVVRPSGDGRVEVLLIHRPAYDDWSLPKGKDEYGESAEEAALRELHEETGHRARIVGRLPDQHYTVGDRPKVVAYFIMRPTSYDGFQPGSEVDEIRWVDLTTAEGMVSYEHDRQLIVDPRVATAARTGSIYLIRHAHAGDRSAWTDDDRLRPITKKGRRQSDRIASMLADGFVDAIYTSPFVRCVQTVEPLAEITGLPIIEDVALADGMDSSSAFDLIERSAGLNVALCSHGDLIPELLDRLARRGTELRSKDGVFACQKGSVWELSIENGVPVSATYWEPPDVSQER